MTLEKPRSYLKMSQVKKKRRKERKKIANIFPGVQFRQKY